MVVVERIPEGVVDHRVDYLAVVHAIAEAGVGQRIGSHRHVLHAAGHDDVGLAGHDHRGSHVNRLQAASADVVDGHRGNGLGDAGMDRSLTGGALTHRSGQDVAENNLVDLIGRDSGAGDRFLHDDGAELLGRDVGEGSTHLADGGTAGADKYDLFAHVTFLHFYKVYFYKPAVQV